MVTKQLLVPRSAFALKIRERYPAHRFSSRYRNAGGIMRSMLGSISVRLLLLVLLYPASSAFATDFDRIFRSLPNLRRDAARLQRSIEEFALGPSCEALAKWSKRFEQEYPDLDLRHTPLEKLYPLEAKLFMDEMFVPYFGKPYDQLSERTRQTIWRKPMRKCFTSSEYRGQFRWQRTMLHHSFEGKSASFTFAQIAPFVARAREIRRKRHPSAVWTGRRRTAMIA